MAKRKGPSTSGPRTRGKAAKEKRDATEAENARRLDKLPQEVWEKILDDIDENDLFPLALSCRYFRQKQKELVEGTGQSGPGSEKPRLALKTSLQRKFEKLEGLPASAEYLRFCYKEKDIAPYNYHRIVCIMAFHGYLPLLQELQDGLNTNYWDPSTFAARGGQLETLKWLKTHVGFRLDSLILSSACEGGQMEIIRWLRSEGCPWDSYACSHAAKGGHFEILKWLRREGCPWDEWACSGAARGGHFEILKWLRSEGCPWNERACMTAARGGHLEVLRWLKSEGCPWDEYTCTQAAMNGHLDVLRWAIDNGCPYEVNHWTRRALKSLGLA